MPATIPVVPPEAAGPGKDKLMPTAWTMWPVVAFLVTALLLEPVSYVLKVLGP